MASVEELFPEIAKDITYNGPDDVRFKAQAYGAEAVKRYYLRYGEAPDQDEAKKMQNFINTSIERGSTENIQISPALGQVLFNDMSQEKEAAQRTVGASNARQQASYRRETERAKAEARKLEEDAEEKPTPSTNIPQETQTQQPTQPPTPTPGATPQSPVEPRGDKEMLREVLETPSTYVTNEPKETQARSIRKVSDKLQQKVEQIYSGVEMEEAEKALLTDLPKDVVRAVSTNQFYLKMMNYIDSGMSVLRARENALSDFGLTSGQFTNRERAAFTKLRQLLNNTMKNYTPPTQEELSKYRYASVMDLDTVAKRGIASRFYGTEFVRNEELRRQFDITNNLQKFKAQFDSILTQASQEQEMKLIELVMTPITTLMGKVFTEADGDVNKFNKMMSGMPQLTSYNNLLTGLISQVVGVSVEEADDPTESKGLRRFIEVIRHGRTKDNFPTYSQFMLDFTNWGMSSGSVSEQSTAMDTQLSDQAKSIRESYLGGLE